MWSAHWVSGHFLTDFNVHYLWVVAGLAGECRARDRSKRGKAVGKLVQMACSERGRASAGSPGPHSTFRYLVKRLYSTRSVDFRSQLTMSVERQNSVVHTPKLAPMVPCHPSLILIYPLWSSDGTHAVRAGACEGWVGGSENSEQAIDKGRRGQELGFQSQRDQAVTPECDFTTDIVASGE